MMEAYLAYSDRGPESERHTLIRVREETLTDLIIGVDTLIHSYAVSAIDRVSPSLKIFGDAKDMAGMIGHIFDSSTFGSIPILPITQLPQNIEAKDRVFDPVLHRRADRILRHLIPTVRLLLRECREDIHSSKWGKHTISQIERLLNEAESIV